jgi:hypothetical protein
VKLAGSAIIAPNWLAWSFNGKTIGNNWPAYKEADTCTTRDGREFLDLARVTAAGSLHRQLIFLPLAR